MDFYPRPPRGGRHAGTPPMSNISLFLSTPSARRATCSSTRSSTLLSYFYPRPPRGGRLGGVPPGGFGAPQFLSTPSARRATYLDYNFSLSNINFYPRPPRGGRQKQAPKSASFELFLSTPSARRATPQPLQRPRQRRTLFLSTPSARRATDPVGQAGGQVLISIHALREEGDDKSLRPFPGCIGISIHALREEGDPAGGSNG